MDENAVLNELISLSLSLGKPENDYVILGEGNTSAKIDDSCFFVKASGRTLSKSNSETFVKVSTASALALLDKEISHSQVKDALFSTLVDKQTSQQPSIETLFHAFLLSCPGINFIGHTHPTAINSILCSENSEEIIKSKIFPDDLKFCNMEYIYIKCPGPGIELAREIREKTNNYLKIHSSMPKAFMIQSHGLVVAGETAQEVEAITAMWCKTAKVMMNTFLFGGPRLLY